MKKPATLARSGSSVTMVPSTRGRSRRVSPASWAAIITAVSAEVATSPNRAHPAQSISAPAELLGLVGVGADQASDAAPSNPRVEHQGVVAVVRALRDPTQKLQVQVANGVGVLPCQPMERAVAQNERAVIVRSGFVPMVLERLLQ